MGRGLSLQRGEFAENGSCSRTTPNILPQASRSHTFPHFPLTITPQPLRIEPVSSSEMDSYRGSRGSGEDLICGAGKGNHYPP